VKSKTFKAVRLLFLGIGLAVLLSVVKKIGFESIKNHVTEFGWELLPILSVGLIWYVCYTLAWRQILKQQGNTIPFWTLFQSKIVGETVNVMTPANFVGGDSMRIYLLHKMANATSIAASVVVDRTVNSIAIVSVIFVGAAFAFFTLPGLPPQIAIGAPVFLVFSTSLIFFFLLRQRKGLFSSILRLALKFHIATKAATKHMDKAIELDEKVLQLYQKSHFAFWSALTLHIAGRFLGVFEVYLIGKTITPEFTLVIALLLATLAPIINTAFTFIPGALGVMEGAYSAALYLLGLNPAIGLTIQIVKRIRATLWIGLGLIFINLFRGHQKASYNKDLLGQLL